MLIRDFQIFPKGIYREKAYLCPKFLWAQAVMAGSVHTVHVLDSFLQKLPTHFP